MPNIDLLGLERQSRMEKGPGEPGPFSKYGSALLAALMILVHAVLAGFA
jgi:hypothetical protein